MRDMRGMRGRSAAGLREICGRSAGGIGASTAVAVAVAPGEDAAHLLTVLHLLRGDAGEMQGRYRGDTGETQGRYRGGTGSKERRISSKCCTWAGARARARAAPGLGLGLGFELGLGLGLGLGLELGFGFGFGFSVI